MQRILFIISFVLLAAAAAAQKSPVIISEVFYDTPLNEDMHAGIPHHNGEYIELLNVTNTEISLAGWKLKDIHQSYIFPEGAVIPAKGCAAAAYNYDGTFNLSEIFPSITSAQAQYIYYHNKIILSNDGEEIKLYDNKDNLIDVMSYGYPKRLNTIHPAYKRMMINQFLWPVTANNYRQKDYTRLMSIQRREARYDSTGLLSSQDNYIVARCTPLTVPERFLYFYYNRGYSLAENDKKNHEVAAMPADVSVTPAGAAVYQLPIELPPGTNGVQPQLSLVYNSQGGFGALGQGWDIAGVSSISRGTQHFYYDGSTLEANTIQFDNRDRLYLDGQRLILLNNKQHLEPGAEYGTEIENFVRVTIGSNSAGICFTAAFPDGRIMEYGCTGDSRLANAENTADERVLAWKLNKVTDVHGNSIVYSYTRRGQYLEKISYTDGINEVYFRYITNNKNPRRQYINNFVVKQDKLLSSIAAYSSQQQVQAYGLNYLASDYDMRLHRIGKYDGNKEITFTHIGWGAESRIERVDLGRRGDLTLSEANSSSIHLGDVNGDGCPDLIELWGGSLKEQGHFRICLFDKNTQAFRQQDASVFYFNYDKDADKNLQLLVGDVTQTGKDNIILIEAQTVRVFSFSEESDDKIREVSRSSHESNLSFEFGSWPWQGADLRKSYLGYTARLIDINHDEYPDLVIVPNSDPSKGGSKSTTFFIGGAEGFTEKTTSGINVEPGENKQYNSQFGDFNADGRLDILSLPEKKTSITKYDKEVRHVKTYIWGQHIHSCSNYITADFNCDGLSDILVQSEKGNHWTLFRNNGGLYVEPSKISIGMHNASNVFEKERYAAHVVDYNGDGLPDIILGDENWTGSSEQFSDFLYTTWYFYKNTGTGFVEEHRIEKDYNRMSRFQGVAADINGDGAADLLLSQGGNHTNYYYFTMPHARKRNLVHQITNGLGQSHKFTYKNYSDYDQDAAEEPLRNLKPPVMVVDAYTNPAEQKTVYTYTGGKVHKHKGFLGFTSVVSENLTTKIKNTTTFKIDDVSYTMVPAKQEIHMGGKLISLSRQEYETVKIDSQKKRFITRVKNETTRDELKNITQHTDYIYDAGHNISRKTIQLNGETVQVTNYIDYKQRNGSGIYYLPGTVTYTNKRAGKPDISSEVRYEYNEKGAVKKKVQFPGTEGEIITEYTYYPAGNPESVTTAPKNCPPAATKYKYDEYYRLPTEALNTLGQVSYTDYDFRKGNVLSETGINGQKTSYEYNSTGRLVKAGYPNGEEVTENVSWSTEDGILYRKESINNKINKRTISWYDYLGRVVRTTQTGANGQDLTWKKEYNPMGQLIKATLPAAAGESVQYTDYEYDEFGRVTAESRYDGNKTLTTSYHYAGLTCTVYHPDGTQSSSTEDIYGGVAQRSDAGGSITYQYNASGQPVEITSNRISTIIEYDKFGRQTALHDPNAGTIKYGYRADGQLSYQVDAKGDSTVMAYDHAGRVKEEILYHNSRKDNLRTVYNYYASGNGIGEISDITLYENGLETHSQRYIYNGSHLLQSVTDTYEGAEYTFHHTYDNLWRGQTTTTPSGLMVENEYDACGNLKKVKNGTAVIWEMKEQDARGRIKAFDLGSGVKTRYTYHDNGQLKEQYTYSGRYGTVIQHMEYEYNPDTYSLITRNDKKNNRRETFNYDELDRLTSTCLNGVLTDSAAYSADGSILSKTDVGTYLYNNERPHAVAGIRSGTQGESLTGIMQQIAYTPFNKVKSVQHSSGNNDRYEIAYGLDRQRIKTSYYQNGVKQYDRYYFGTYEKEVSSTGKVTEIDHIYTPGGLTAIHIASSSGSSTQGAAGLSYVHTDNMGSVQVITDKNSNAEAEYLYTAWGGRITLKSPLAGNLGSFSRGYTGHEHLEPLGLINMNGRIYDPVLARFLSPDPYVQAPDYTQGFNRYSYCLNNPFKYTDPSGELFFYVQPGFSYSNKGGLSLSLSAGVGFSGGASLGGTVGYNFKHENWTFTANISGAGLYAYGGYDTSAGWIAGAGWGLSGINHNGFGFGTNLTSVGVGWSQYGGWNANAFAFQFGNQGISFDPGFNGSYILDSGEYGSKYIYESDVVDDSEESSGPIQYTAEFVKKFMEVNELSDEGIRNLITAAVRERDLIIYPDGRVWSKSSKSFVAGQTIYRGKKYFLFGERLSDVYLYKVAFTSKKTLYLTLGHELIHVQLYRQGYTDIDRHEKTAYKWTLEQIEIWGNKSSKWEEKYNSYNVRPYPFKFTYRITNPL